MNRSDYYKEFNINIYNSTPILFNHNSTDGIEQAPHFHDFAELYMYVSGDAGYYIDGRFYDLERGDLVLVLPNEIHRPLLRSRELYERYFIKLAPSCFSNLRPGQESPVWFLDPSSGGQTKGALLRLETCERRNVMSAFQTIDRLHDENAADFGTVSYSMLLGILSTVGEAIRAERFAAKSSLPPMIESMINSLDENLAFPPSVEATARRFGVSPSYVSRVFKRYMGIGFNDYISAARISQAKKLLSAGATVTEACYECGFSDCSHFISVFKRHVGMTPKKYRQGGSD